jgi:peptidoglycan-associated lipoprotein
MGRRWLGMLVVCVCVAVLASACSSKKKGGEETMGAAGAGAPGVGEEGLGTAGSLDRARQGLTPGEGGPLKDINFPYDSFDLDEAARAILRSNADWLNEHAGSRVEIEGHCDERGTVEYNLALGAKRAGAVKEYLVALGVAGDRLSTISYGEELPLCTEHTEDCWARNRRVHFAVVSE